MPTITLAIPEDMKREMDECKEINWSQVAREAIRDKLTQLMLLKKITSKSKLTEKDALELGKNIRMAVHERHKKKYGS